MNTLKLMILLTAFWLIPLSMVNATIHQYELENGLRILVKQDHRAPVVVSQVWYKVGSSYEHDGITGISHVLEHMMFKGTKKYPAGEFSRIISENGGRDNAFTGRDYTAYFQTLEKSRLKISFELEADRMRFLSLPEEEFEKEIEVVKEERRLRTEDNPRAYLYEVAMATAFQTSPYRFPIIGWMHDLDNMAVQQLRDWYLAWYAPNNAIVVVVGDIEPKEVFTLAKEYFGALPRGKTIQLNLEEETQQVGVKRIKVKRPAELPYLMMSYKVVSEKPNLEIQQEYDWEPYALEVLSGILDGGSAARLSSRLVRGCPEVAASVSVNYTMASRLDSLLTISGIPAKNKTVQDLELAFRKELIDLQTNLVNKEELQRIKAQVISNNIYEKDSMFYQAMTIGILETVGLSYRLIDTYVERIKAVTAEQVHEVAKKYLIDDRLTITELDPLPLDMMNDSTEKKEAVLSQVHK